MAGGALQTEPVELLDLRLPVEVSLERGKTEPAESDFFAIQTKRRFRANVTQLPPAAAKGQRAGVEIAGELVVSEVTDGCAASNENRAR